MKNKKGILLIGSPKLNKSISYCLGNLFVNELSKKGYEFNIYYSHSLIGKDMTQLFEDVNQCDTIIVTSPLYVDSLPSPLLEVLEKINENRKEIKQKKDPFLISILNSGFPESSQSQIALKICKEFAIKSDFKWLGGFAIGGGSMYVDRDGLNKRINHKMKGFHLVINDIISNEPISKETIRIIEKKVVPHWIYGFILNRNFSVISKKLGTFKNIKDKPFEK